MNACRTYCGRRDSGTLTRRTIGEAADEPSVAVEDASALARLERADLRGATGSRRSRRCQPGVERHDADAGEREQP